MFEAQRNYRSTVHSTQFLFFLFPAKPWIGHSDEIRKTGVFGVAGESFAIHPRMVREKHSAVPE